MTDDTCLDDRLDPLEPPYQSRGETEIGRLLDRQRVPFHYGQPIVILDADQYHIWHPAFTLPQYLDLIIEYMGLEMLLEAPEEVARREQVYRSNGVAALFVYPDDLQRRDLPQRMIERIERIAEETHRTMWGRYLPGNPDGTNDQ